MLIQIDFQSETPIYLQLKNQIIEGIATGKLKPGESLPSVRQLAGDLGINLHTVNKAYNYLRQDGFILIHRQKGVVVNPERVTLVTDEYRLRLINELQPIVTEAYCRGMDEKMFQEVCKEICTKLKGGD